MSEHQPLPKFRVLAEDLDKKTTVYSIHQVTYNDLGDLVGYSKFPLTLIDFCEGEMLDDIIEVLDAYELPILSIENFPENYEDL